MQSFGSYHAYLADRLTPLRTACTTEAVIGGAEGASCFFMVNGANPKNGIIPSHSFGVAAPLQMVGLEAAAEAKSIEQTIMGELPELLCRAVNAQIDRSIIAALEGCDGIAAVEGTGLDVVLKSEVVLGNNEVPIEEEDNMFCVITPAMRAMLLERTEYASGDYVFVRAGSRQVKVWCWAGKNWLVAPTPSGRSYMFHRHAVGHALGLLALAVPGAVTGGVDLKTGLGWMKAKTMQLATVLQRVGVVSFVVGGDKQ